MRSRRAVSSASLASTRCERRVEPPALGITCGAAGVVGRERVDDIGEAEADGLELARERDPLDGARRELPVPRRSAIRGWEHADALVVAHGVDRHSGLPCNFSDLHEYPLTLDLTPESLMHTMTTTLHLPARQGAAIACDMRTAKDSPDKRMRAYDRLFADALRDRERRENAVVFTFGGGAGTRRASRSSPAARPTAARSPTTASRPRGTP